MRGDVIRLGKCLAPSPRVDEPFSSPPQTAKYQRYELTRIAPCPTLITLSVFFLYAPPPLYAPTSGPRGKK